MRRRVLEERDLPVLREIYDKLPYKFTADPEKPEAGGFPDFLSEEYVAADVVVDADDRPLMVVGAKRVVEMVMICDPSRHVLIRLQGIALLHDWMRILLRSLGYREASSFIPPEIEKTHGRTMERRFGWQRAWKGYRVT